MIDSINQSLNKIINHIPEEFRHIKYLDYISELSFQQLAMIKIFNNTNSTFSFEIIPSEVIDDYISFNILSKEKAKIENNDIHCFPNEQDTTFEEVYQKIQHLYQKQDCLVQLDALFPFNINEIDSAYVPNKLRNEIALEKNSNLHNELSKIDIDSGNNAPTIDSNETEQTSQEIEDNDTALIDNLKVEDVISDEFQVDQSAEKLVDNSQILTTTPISEDYNDNSILSSQQNNTESVIQSSTQVNGEILERYNPIIQKIDHFFHSLCNIGYAHFDLIAKDLKIENLRIDTSVYSSTAAVIICFKLLSGKGAYTKYQNLLLTLSNLFKNFNLKMIQPVKQQQENEKNDKTYLCESSIMQITSMLEPFYIEYLKNIDVEEFLHVLEIRCAYDNWLLDKKNDKNIEIPINLLPPSKYSEYDLRIASCLIENKEFSDEMKPRIDDFIHLFTYLNITEGTDKRFLINDWTKPEIESVKNTLLNFGSNSVFSLDFIPKTYIITKSIRSISTFVNQILKNTNSKTSTKIYTIEGIDDKLLNQINENTKIYDKVRKISANPNSYSFNDIELEFLDLILKHGLQSFDDIFLDSRYSFKTGSPLFVSFESFVNRINKEEGE